MVDVSRPAELAGSVVGKRLAWFLDQLRDGGAAVTDEDVAATWLSDLPAPPPPVRRVMLAHFAAMIGPFSVQSYEVRRADFALALLNDERRRTWRVWVQIEPTSPHRIRMAWCVRTPPAGVTVRRVDGQGGGPLPRVRVEVCDDRD